MEDATLATVRVGKYGDDRLFQERQGGLPSLRNGGMAAVAEDRDATSVSPRSLEQRYGIGRQMTVAVLRVSEGECQRNGEESHQVQGECGTYGPVEVVPFWRTQSFQKQPSSVWFKQRTSSGV